MDSLLISSKTLFSYLLERKNRLLYEWDLLSDFYPEYKNNKMDLDENDYYSHLFHYHFSLYHSIHRLDCDLEAANSLFRVGLSLSFIKMVQREEDQCAHFYSNSYVFCHQRRKEGSKFCEHHLNLFKEKLPDVLDMRHYYMNFENLKKMEQADLENMIEHFYFYVDNENILHKACKILDVSLNCSFQELQNQYKKKVWEYHPDSNPNANLGKIQELNECYSIMKGFLGSTALFSK